MEPMGAISVALAPSFVVTAVTLAKSLLRMDWPCPTDAGQQAARLSRIGVRLQRKRFPNAHISAYGRIEGV